MWRKKADYFFARDTNLFANPDDADLVGAYQSIRCIASNFEYQHQVINPQNKGKRIYTFRLVVFERLLIVLSVFHKIHLLKQFKIQYDRAACWSDWKES